MSMPRRSLLKATLGISVATPLHAVAQRGSSFESLFKEALQEPEQLAAVRNLREHLDILGSKAAAPRVKRSERKIAQEAVRMLVLFEVTDEKRYTSKYQNPVWPGGNSGMTMGIGYDLGYVRATWLNEDWGDELGPGLLSKLKPACGLTGVKAKAISPQLSDVVVPWSAAMKQFEDKLLPLYVGATLQAAPLATKLADERPKCMGALVSLVYNRGPSFSKQGDRYAEMRAIKAALASGSYDRIPGHIRAMKRLWDIKELPGLHQRRDLEAALFQEGLL